MCIANILILGPFQVENGVAGGEWMVLSGMGGWTDGLRRGPRAHWIARLRTEERKVRQISEITEKRNRGEMGWDEVVEI